MDIGATFVADRQPSKPMEPRDRPFDHPATGAEATAVWGATAREDGRDAARAEAITMRLGVVAAVALQRVRARPGTPASPAYRGQGVNQRVELRDVVDVGRGYLRDKRDAARIDDEVMLGALLAAIGWVRSSFFPPRTARTDPLSMMVHRWSSRPRRRSSASSASWRRCHTPARCQRTSRRQHVLPDPQPIWRGNICQGMPERRTKRMPVSTARSGIGERPCRCPRFGRRLGNNGSSRAQIASSIRA